MFEKLRHILKLFLGGKTQDSYIQDRYRKVLFVNFFGVLGEISLIVFFVISIVKGYSVTYSVILFIFIVLTAIILFFHKRLKLTNFVAWSLVILMFIFVLVIVIYIGKVYTGPLWLYIFPILSIILVGNKNGATLSIILGLIVSWYILFHPINGGIYYPKSFFVRFFVSYYVVVAMVAFTEHIRSKTLDLFNKTISDRALLIENLKNKNEEINQQSESLKEINKELEILSIVAKETNNLVLITDKGLKILWLNNTFERLTGYDLNQYTSICPNLIECLDNRRVVVRAIETKTPVQFTKSLISSKGERFWFNYNLSFSFQDDGEIKYVIFVATDITQIMQFEKELILKNDELQQQKKLILEQKQVLEQKNKLISEYNKNFRQSVLYAKTIQYSIFSSFREIDEILEYFLLYFPKDIISGDFFWFRKTEDHIIVAVADCTGHGVAAAFMSVIGTRLLNEIVFIKKIFDPKEILKKLDEYWHKTFNKESTENEDGMDIVIVRIPVEGNNKKLVFSSAKRPLIYYDSLSKKVDLVKGTRKSIGGWKSDYNKLDFENKTLILSKGSILYLTTDGFVDQHNNQRRRYGTIEFLKKLQKIADYPLERQKISLIFDFELYKQDQKQTDDIIVLGLKI